MSVDIIFGQGISKTGELVDLAADLDIIQKSGAWFAYDGEKIGQGRENAKAYLEKNPEKYQAIFKAVLEHFKIAYK